MYKSVAVMLAVAILSMGSVACTGLSQTIKSAKQGDVSSGFHLKSVSGQCDAMVKGALIFDETELDLDLHVKSEGNAATGGKGWVKLLIEGIGSTCDFSSVVEPTGEIKRDSQCSPYIELAPGK